MANRPFRRITEVIENIRDLANDLPERLRDRILDAAQARTSDEVEDGDETDDSTSPHDE